MTWWQPATGAALLGALVTISACSTPKDPILVDEGMIVVENLTSREWRNVKVTLNDHFIGGAPVLLPGGVRSWPAECLQSGSHGH